MVKIDCNERFWSKVQQADQDACWLWLAGKDRSGYGRFLFEGKNRHAHIVAWILSYGPIPSNKIVRHTCDVYACVNPSHLLLGTQLDNIRDRVQRGRCHRPYGALNSQAKLTPEKVALIRQEYATTRCSKKSLAIKYSMSNSAIGRLLNKQTW
jgi:hypothetical protein